MSWWSDLWRYGFTAEQRRLSRATEHYSRSLAAYEQELQRLASEEARQQAALLLSAPSMIRVHRWTGRISADLASLTDHQQSIFGQVRRIEALNGEPYVDAAELGPYEGKPSLARIGLDSEHAYIVIRQGEEPVYVVDETEDLDLDQAQQFPTLSHWVLWLNRSGELLASRDEPAA
jgi:hypothetical protein